MGEQFSGARVPASDAGLYVAHVHRCSIEPVSRSLGSLDHYETGIPVVLVPKVVGSAQAAKCLTRYAGHHVSVVHLMEMALVFKAVNEHRLAYEYSASGLDADVLSGAGGREEEAVGYPGVVDTYFVAPTGRKHVPVVHDALASLEPRHGPVARGSGRGVRGREHERNAGVRELFESEIEDSRPRYECGKIVFSVDSFAVGRQRTRKNLHMKDIILEITEKYMIEEAIANFKLIPKEAKVHRVVDIGAHAGSLTCFAAARGCRVLAVEPLEIDRLAKNIYTNQLQRKVSIIQAAVVANAPSEHCMRRVANDAMVGVAYLEDRTMDGGDALGITPQQILDIFGPPDFLKFDIEGGEWELLHLGVLQPLLQASRFVDFEVHAEGEFFPKGFTHDIDFPGLMVGLGFELLHAGKNSLWKKAWPPQG